MAVVLTPAPACLLAAVLAGSIWTLPAQPQLPPPNVVENGDARSGDAAWGA